MPMIIDLYSDGTARADLCKKIQIVLNKIRGGSTGCGRIQKYWIKCNQDRIEWKNWMCQ